MEIAGLTLLLLISVPIVGAIRHREEGLLAAYLIFAVTFLMLAAVTFLTLVNAAQRWQEVTVLNIVLTPVGIILLSIIPAYVLGLWLASRSPYKNPRVE